MWILTEKVNQYTQYGGEYFIEGFDEKPSPELLKVVVSENGYSGSDEFVNHVLNGGGRIAKEDQWLHLSEHQPRTL